MATGIRLEFPLNSPFMPKELLAAQYLS